MMAYRASFAIEMFVEIGYMIAQIIFFNILYGNLSSISGWTRYEMLFLIGIDMFVGELIIGMIFANNTNTLPEKIRNGDVDFTLLKPVGSLFFLTLSSTYLPSLFTSLIGIYFICIAISHLTIVWSLLNILGFIIIFLCGFIISYSVMVIIASLSFIFINAKPLPRLGMNTMIQFTDKPFQMFDGVFLKIIFFFIFPSVFITSIPVHTIIKGLNYIFLFQAIFLAGIFLFLVNWIWSKMIARYSSASS
ncbi:MAG: ABC-2 family transporter protein [bacterium]|nr:ABC-2 family transporter protein [bacterium]